MRFDTKASTYEANARIQRVLSAWLAEWLEPSLVKTAAVLEVGAGTGLFTRELKKFGKIDALDLSRAMISEGRQHLPEVRWRIGDGFNLPPACCDRLYSSALLQWAANPAATAQNWFSALKPGGRMLHGAFVAPTLAELAAIAKDAMPVYWRGPDEWLAAFEGAGFRILRAEENTCEQRHASALCFLRELHSTGVTAAGARLSAGRLRTLLKLYEKNNTVPGGCVRSTWSLLRFEAEKR